MYLSEEESKRRLEHPAAKPAAEELARLRAANPPGPAVSIVDAEVVQDEAPSILHAPTRPGGRRGPELTPEMRKLIGVAAHFDTAKDVAQVFGVSPITVAAAKHGKIGTHSQEGRKDPELAKEIELAVDTKRRTVSDKAIGILLATMGVITDDKLKDLGPIAAATVADKMSNIVDRMSPKGPSAAVAQVVVYSPKERDESSYLSIQVTAFEPQR